MTAREPGHILWHPLSRLCPANEGANLMAIEIYCVKCKAKTDSTNVESVTMKNGRPATKALCVVCGAGKYRIGATPAETS